MPELARLRDQDLIRLLALIVVVKGDGGELTRIESSDLGEEEALPFARLAQSLLGISGDEVTAPGGDEPILDGSMLDDRVGRGLPNEIPSGVTAAVALIEHRWAIQLRETIRRVRGVPLADRWVHPDDLPGLSRLAEEP